jgi:hypothetical protein
MKFRWETEFKETKLGRYRGSGRRVKSEFFIGYNMGLLLLQANLEIVDY